MGHHITSHHIISYHIISYHIISYHDITWVSKMTFFKSSGDLFFDPNDCRLSLRKGSRNFLRSLLTDFFPGPRNGPKWPNMVKKGQKKIWKKKVSKVGGMGPKALLNRPNLKSYAHI